MQTKRMIVRAGLLLVPVLSTSLICADLFQTIKNSDAQDVPFSSEVVEGDTGITSRDHEKDEIIEGDSIPVATQFKDNKDGTVTDCQRALMWTKEANLLGDTITLHQARDYVEGMNKGNHQNFGYTNWRLPTRGELRNLIDYTKYQTGGHTLPSGHPFDNVQSLSFNDRSQDTYLTTGTHQWFMLFYCSIFGRNSRYCQGFLWTVRSVETRSSPTDTDGDSVLNTVDNCPSVYNPDQEDTYPVHGNGIGDACDCEGDINCDGTVDASDMYLFKQDFQRRTQLQNPCTNEDACNGDFDCDGDVDEDDESLLQADLGRGHYHNPCPPCNKGPWCVYP